MVSGLVNPFDSAFFPDGGTSIKVGSESFLGSMGSQASQFAPNYDGTKVVYLDFSLFGMLKKPQENGITINILIAENRTRWERSKVLRLIKEQCQRVADPRRSESRAAPSPARPTFKPKSHNAFTNFCIVAFLF